MTQPRLPLVAAGLVAALAICFACSSAVADDDTLAPPPASPGAPPPPGGNAAAKPDAPAKPTLPTIGPATTAPSTAKPAAPKSPTVSAPGWGDPAASPTSGPSSDLLPAPLIRNPRTGATSGGLPPAPIPVPRNTTSYPRNTVPTTGTTLPAAPGARVTRVTKVHNVPMAGGQLALRLDIEFNVVGQRGQMLKLAAAYAKGGGGGAIQSVMPAYAGERGNIVSKTAPVRAHADGTYRASLWVPYGAFPAAAAGSSYLVHVLVQLQRESGGQTRVMSHQRTTFTVHGPAVATR